jgi:hypothetical protein
MREVEATAKRLQAERNESDALSVDDVALKIRNKVSPALLIENQIEDGVNFPLPPELRARFKAAGADDSVLDAIATSKR